MVRVQTCRLLRRAYSIASSPRRLGGKSHRGHYGFCRIDSVFICLHLKYCPVLANEQIHSTRSFISVHEKAILLRHFPTPVTEQREGHAQSVGKRFVDKWAVHADAQNLCIRCFNPALLEVLHLLAAATCESKDVERQHHILLAPIITELHTLQVAAIEVLESEIGSDAANADWILCF